jgi:hypothetical protein
MSALLALLSAVCYGAADFLGGLTAKRASTLAVVVMAVVAPTTAVCAVAIPVIVAVGLGERPGPVTIGGIVCAIVAVTLIVQ